MWTYWLFATDAYYSHLFEDEFKQAANSVSDIIKKYNKKDEIHYFDYVYFLFQ